MAQITDQNGRPITLSTYQKNEIYNKAKALKEQIRESLCSREETRNPTDRNIDKMQNSEFKIKDKIDRYKKSMQAIGADPKDYDVERLRR